MKIARLLSLVSLFAFGSAFAQKATVIPPKELPVEGDVTAFSGTYRSSSCIGTPAKIVITTYFSNSDQTYVVHVVEENTKSLVSDYVLGSVHFVKNGFSYSIATLIDGNMLLSDATLVPLSGQGGFVSASKYYTLHGNSLKYFEILTTSTGDMVKDPISCTYERVQK